MPVAFTILGSGSSGNCAYLETASTRLLIDAGLSGRQIRQRLLSLGRAPEGLNGIVITHEHGDHTRGLTALAAKLRVPIYCNRFTGEAIQAGIGAPCEFRFFETGATFDLGDVVIETFPVPHDAQDPVGFNLRTNCGAIGVLTDLGHATKLVVQRMRETRVLVLETNHDVMLLQNNPHRPWSLKQRILSRHGHLSNEAAADALELMLNASLEHLFLAHLSRDCNRPEMALEAVQTRLERQGVRGVQVCAAEQDVPCRTVMLENLPTPALTMPDATE